jgi:hypothetical protein
MATFGSMQSYIAKRLIDPSGTAVDSSDIQEAINNSIAYWKLRRFWFNEVSDKDTLTAQSASFPYPADFLMPALKDDGFYIEYANVRYPLVKIEQTVYDALYLANGYGLPRWYARTGNQEYQVYPIPNLNYTVGRHYLKEYNDLVNASDTNDFTINASRLVNLWALANLVTELRQDVAMGDYYRAAAQNEYRNLRVRTDKENATGKVTIYSQLNRR